MDGCMGSAYAGAYAKHFQEKGPAYTPAYAKSRKITTNPMTGFKLQKQTLYMVHNQEIQGSSKSILAG